MTRREQTMSLVILSSLGRWCLLFLVLLASAALVLPARAAPSQEVPVYSTDFSTDPGWSTNNPATNYWDAGKGMFHYLMRDGSGTYVYREVPYGGEAFTLSFDILPERTDFQARVKFGLGDGDQVTVERLTMFTELEHGEYGRIFWIRSIDLQNQRREASSYFLSYYGPTVEFEDGVWYHMVMDYSPGTRSLSLSVYRRNDSRPVWHYTLDNVADFPTMDRISMSKIGDSRNPNAIAEGYIDNVAFSYRYPSETMAPATQQAPAVTSPPPAGTTVPVTSPPAGGTPASGQIPLTVLPVLAALALSILLAGAVRGRKK
jgi:hypothetical protein